MKSENATFSNAMDNLLKVTYMEVNCISKERGGNGNSSSTSHWCFFCLSLTTGLPLRPQAPLSGLKDGWMRQLRVKAKGCLHSFLVRLSGLLGTVTLQDNLARVWAVSMQRTSLCPCSRWHQWLNSSAGWLPTTVLPMALISCLTWKSDLSWQNDSPLPTSTNNFFTSWFPQGCIFSYSKPCIL